MINEAELRFEHTNRLVLLIVTPDIVGGEKNRPGEPVHYEQRRIITS